MGTAGAAAFGAVGVAAALGRSGAGLVDAVLPSLVAAVTAAAVLRLLLRPGSAPAAPVAPGAPAAPLTVDRRRFLVRTGGVVAAGAAAGGVGRALQRRHRVGAARARIVLPAAARPAPPRPDGMDVGVPGVDPFVTPDGAFYRIDTALVAPQVSPDGWRLGIHGLVERELSFSYDDLPARPLVERDATLVCVSNEVGGR